MPFPTRQFPPVLTAATEDNSPHQKHEERAHQPPEHPHQGGGVGAHVPHTLLRHLQGNMYNINLHSLIFIYQRKIYNLCLLIFIYQLSDPWIQGSVR